MTFKTQCEGCETQFKLLQNQSRLLRILIKEKKEVERENIELKRELALLKGGMRVRREEVVV